MRERFKEAMDKEHGPGTWDLMELKAKQRSTMGQFEFDQLEKYYKEKVNELLNSKHLSG